MNSSLQHRGTPPAEVDVTTATVRSLLERQHPDLAGLPLRPVDAGWDNAIFRLGEDLAVRLPRRSVAARSSLHEHEWLPKLAAVLPLPVPVPLRTGRPGCGYPWHWSVVPWLAGTVADTCALDNEQGARLAAFFSALHVPAPASAPVNRYRGVPLTERRASVEERMGRLEDETDLITADIRRIWNQALEAPLAVDSTWLHGDLHAQNVLVDAGVISGILDWGDVCAGDRATDLAAVWMLLADRHAREAAMHMCAVCDATWSRARGWAILFGIVLVDTGLVGNRRHAAMGAQTLLRVAEGP